MKDMKLKVWVVLEADRGMGAHAEVFSSKERAEAVYPSSSKVYMYETEIDEEFNMLDDGD